MSPEVELDAADAVQQAYAEVAYPGGAFAHTHPARHAAVAALLGCPSPSPRTARVLEIGCAQGYNLLPLAARLPEAHFTGIDFAEPGLAAGRSLAEAAGLRNVKLLQADLRDFDAGSEKFDYIIAHGVLSWVPDDAKAALFQLCARSLAPDGLAYISYNTYPGWKNREALRELMLMRLRGVTSHRGRLDAASSTLQILDAALAGSSHPPAAIMRELIAAMKSRAENIFYHDDLDGINDPCYFLQFAEWAAEHNLRYIGEADFRSMIADDLPKSALAALSPLRHDQLLTEQHLDFVRNRSFRCSLIGHNNRTPKPELQPGALRQCAFGSALKSEFALPVLTEGRRVQFKGSGQICLQSADSVTKALLAVLANVWPHRLPFQDLLSETRNLLSLTRTEMPPDLEHALLGRLLDICAKGVLDFMIDSGVSAQHQVSARPFASPLVRHSAAQNLPVVNAWHEAVILDPVQRSLLSTLDGTREDFSDLEKTSLENFARLSLLATAA